MLFRSSGTTITDEQVELEILPTRLCLLEDLVGHGYLALLSTAAELVGERADVGEAAEVTEVLLDAAAVRHSTVHRVRDDDHFVCLALRLEGLPLTVLSKFVLLCLRRCCSATIFLVYFGADFVIRRV